MSPHRRTGLLAAGIVGGLFLLVVGGVGVAVLASSDRDARNAEALRRFGEPDPNEKYASRTDKKGAEKPRQDLSGPVSAGPTASREGVEWTIQELVGHLQSKGVINTDRLAYHTLDMPEARLVSGGEEILEILHCDSPRKARDTAAARGREASMSWGRFAISGKRRVLDACRRVLEG